jgi:hypothetical protein
MPNGDFIPSADNAFLAWARNFYTVCSENVGPWNLPEQELQDIGNGVDDFEVLLYKCHSEARTKADTRAKNDKHKTLEKMIRGFVNEYIRANHRISKSDKVRLGVTVAKDPHPIPETTGTPEMEADISTPLVIVLRYRARGAKRWGKAKHVHGIETRHEMRDDNPNDWEDLKHSTFDTGGAIHLTFKAADAGKRVVINSRWEMGKVDGERGKGPWGTAIVVHVPG